MTTQLLERNREIYAQRVTGQTYTAIARQHKISVSRVKQIFEKVEREMKKIFKQLEAERQRETK